MEGAAAVGAVANSDHDQEDSHDYTLVTAPQTMVVAGARAAGGAARVGGLCHRHSRKRKQRDAAFDSDQDPTASDGGSEDGCTTATSALHRRAYGDNHHHSAAASSSDHPSASTGANGGGSGNSKRERRGTSALCKRINRTLTDVIVPMHRHVARLPVSTCFFLSEVICVYSCHSARKCLTLLVDRAGRHVQAPLPGHAQGLPRHHAKPCLTSADSG